MPSLDRRLFLQSSSLLFLSGGTHWVLGEEADPTPNFAEKVSFKPTGLFLTWQQDPTSTMTVQWVGNEADAAMRPLWICRKGSNRWRQIPFAKRPLPLSKLFAFRAEATGLESNAEYAFHVGLDSPRERFRTMPAKDTGDIEFISGGDSGAGRAAEHTNQLAAKRSPRFVVLGGDLAYENGASAETFVKFLSNYSRDLRDSEGRMIPLLGCLGNHEVKGGSGRSRLDAPFFYTFFDGLFPETGSASLDFGNYLSLVLLDSNHTTPIAGAQTDWLEKTLREREEFPTVFVHYHVPAYPSFRSPDSGASPVIREHWVPLFERYNVDAVMEHHDHTYKRTYPMLAGMKNANGIQYLGDGSWGKIRPVKTPDKDHPYLAVAQESYHLSIHRLEGKSQSHIAISDEDKIVDTCTTSKRARRRSK
jgi:hypothetical protein